PDNTVAGTVRDRRTGRKTQGQVPEGVGVHSAYEDDMVNRHVQEIFQGVDSYLSQHSLLPNVVGGHEAAVAVIELMQKTFDTIAPRKIIAEFMNVQDEKPAGRADAMWESLGEDTIRVMGDGCICLAQIWDSAWQEGNGDTTINSLAAIDETVLSNLYQDPN